MWAFLAAQARLAGPYDRLRAWPSVAESWAPVCVRAFVIFGDVGARIVGPAHLVIGYATLGVILALRPHLTGTRD